MYLLVIVMLIIGMLGIYAQVLVVQAQQYFAQQNGFAAAMIAWHNAAVSMAASTYDTNLLYGTSALNKQKVADSMPCSLTYLASNPNALNCPPPLYTDGTNNLGGNVVGYGVVTHPNGWYNYIFNPKTKIIGEYVHIKTSLLAFPKSPYQFYSVLAFNTNNEPFAITYVSPPAISAANPPPGFIVLPPAVPSTQQSVISSFSMADLAHQLKMSNVPAYSYGYVTNDTVNNLTNVATSQYVFQLKQTNVNGTTGDLVGTLAPNGSLAIVSSIAGY
jgi:hypothetical protein